MNASRCVCSPPFLNNGYLTQLRELEALAAAKLEQFLTLTRRNADLKLRNTVSPEA